MCHIALIKTLRDTFKVDCKQLILIANYLANRKYLIKIEKFISKSFTVNRGIGQGSVLGPNLFILYFNEVCHVLRDCSYSVFADDLAIYVSGKDVEDLLKRAVVILETLESWFSLKGLAMNHDKTKFMIIHKKQCRLSSNIKLVVNGTDIEQVNTLSI